MSPAGDPDVAVLVGDDDPGKRLAILAILAPLDLATVEASSGEAALRAVMERSFAVILMDVRMPGMDGYETAGLIRLRRESEHTPIIFITGQEGGAEQTAIAYASGAVDFMVGTLTPSVLRAKVAIFVELFRRGHELEQSLAEVTELSRQALRSTEELRHQTLHDALTGLPNRLLFADRVDQAIRGATRDGGGLALFVLDVDDFKQVNDSLGHDLGDELLRLVAQRLVSCLRGPDTVARLGGDEFGILATTGDDLAGAGSIAEKVQHALLEPFVVSGHHLDVRASIGITLFPDHGSTLVDLMRRADLAMYDAKRSGRGHALFASEQEDEPVRRLALLANLRRCVEEDELVLRYQPKVDLRTRQVTGLEALLRWNHPSGRLVMPDEFIPAIEGNELMNSITAWVIGEAVQRLHLLREQGFDLSMAVNLGARCVVDDTDLFADADRRMEELGLPPQKLTFELTETALIDTAGPAVVDRLKGVSQGVSIDDFGTGWSSLLYLQRLPVTEVKADRSFVGTMTQVRDDAVIVRSIIELAHNLSIAVVAEGVEDEATMDLLIEYGCDVGQGWHFARPMAGELLADHLDTARYGCARTLNGVKA